MLSSKASSKQRERDAPLREGLGDQSCSQAKEAACRLSSRAPQVWKTAGAAPLQELSGCLFC